MGPKESFEQSARRALQGGPPPPGEPGPFTSVHETVHERAPLPISDALPRSIEFRRKRESWFSFPYHCLMSLEYLPHGQITLMFSTHKVVVCGRSLERLYQQIRKQRCEGVEEMERAAALSADSGEAVVESISVVELGGPSESPAPAPDVS